MNNLTFEEMYEAIGKKESTYEGSFITAVKSTGIFCRPSCRARKPLAKNVEFFRNAEEALKHGYRPCKICRPLELEYETPPYIRKLIEEIAQKPYNKIKDWDLKSRGLEPSHIRRWFKAHHGMTFHAYQRLIRLNTGFNQIKNGSDLLNSAFDSGYESLSGFNDGYKAIFGASPNKAKDKGVIYLERVTTKIGPMFFAATEKGLCLLEFTDRRMLESEFKDLCKRLNSVIIPGTNNHIKMAKSQFSEYLSGKRREFSVLLDTPGTDFQMSVWETLKKIPYGQTWSYSDQAKDMGKPKSVRAVANANGMNRVAVIIPCHRVIGSDGSLTGYGGGLARKKHLLELEKSNLD